MLRGVNLEIRTGQTLVIIGRSGGGKSVLLKHLIGLLETRRGRDPRRRARTSRSGRTPPRADPPQGGHPVPARRAVRFHERRGKRGVSLRESGERDPRATSPKRCARRWTWSSLDGHQKKMPVNLSGGMKKRVALARAIICRPRCILYDEPTAGLDPVVSDSINLLIRRLQERFAVTSLVVTHDMKSAFEIATASRTSSTGASISRARRRNSKRRPTRTSRISSPGAAAPWARRTAVSWKGDEVGSCGLSEGQQPSKLCHPERVYR